MKLIDAVKNKKVNIRTKLILVFVLTSAVLFAVNLYVYVNINKMMNSIEAIYASNISINNMADDLTRIQENMSDYLQTRSSDSLEAYYKNFQSYSNSIRSLNDETVDDDLLMMQKAITRMSGKYLSLTSDAITAKRGRNIEGYTQNYEQAGELYSYISTYIYSMNNEQFRSNSENYAMLLSSMRYSEILCLSILLVVSLANVLLIVLMTRSITKPLIELSKQANEISAGNLNVELIDVKSEDEVGIVTSAFNKMVVSINEYIAKIQEQMESERILKEKELIMDANLKEAQLKYLQAQINPHFLFNTLNAGAQLAMMEGADRTNKYVQTMADFFRYNVQKNNDRVTLKQELELVDNYIYILNVRFAGEIHYEKEIDEDLLNLAIPSMTLQPIIENAVNYGIRNIDWEGRICTRVYKEGECAVICIEDNGIGMSEELVGKINAREVAQSTVHADSNGVGLNNVITRLNLFYDRDDIFKITSEGENKGSKVYIRIPLAKEPAEEE